MAVRNFRPSAIDIALIGNPDLRDRVDAMAVDYGLSCDRFTAEIHKLGIQCSRSAAARYRVKRRPGYAGPISPFTAAIIAKLLTMNRAEQTRVADFIGVKRPI